MAQIRKYICALLTINHLCSIISIQIVANALKITHFKVPATAVRGQSVNFICAYDLENDNLYSLKWYRNETEFYRFEPKGEKQVQVFPIPEINLDFRKSKDGTTIRVPNVSPETSGVYKCELSADVSFLTVSKEQMMTVKEVNSGPSLLISKNQFWLNFFTVFLNMVHAAKNRGRIRRNDEPEAKSREMGLVNCVHFTPHYQSTFLPSLLQMSIYRQRNLIKQFSLKLASQ